MKFLQIELNKPVKFYWKVLLISIQGIKTTVTEWFRQQQQQHLFKHDKKLQLSWSGGVFKVKI